VLTTFKAKGLFPDTYPLGAGVLGRSGTPVASWLMNEADLLIAVGTSFPCRWLGFRVMAGRWGGRGLWRRFRR
jgi:thiamine pyrophosphate-dependent acetolactate synthase large subunit-like protein